MSASSGEQPVRSAVRRAAPLVAISATYGAGGAQVGERVARTLGVPFLGHTFTSEEMVQARGAQEPQASAYLHHRTRGDMAVDDSVAISAVKELQSRSFFEESDAAVLDLVETGGVVVGRAGPYVLRDIPGVLHVLLDGPPEARAAAGAALEGIDPAEAARRQIAHDESRLTIARLHYGADPNELQQYSMVLDTTALGLDATAEILVIAARARHAAANPDAGS